MADGARLDIPDMAALLAELQDLPQRIQAKVVIGAVATGASVMRKAVRAAAPMDTGRLRQAVYQVRLPEDSTETLEMWKVAISQDAKITKRKGKESIKAGAFYARFVEYGHFTRSTETGKVGGARFKASERRALTAGRMAEVKGAQWVPAKPFFWPAYHNTQQAALAAMAEYLRENLAMATSAGRYVKAISS